MKTTTQFIIIFAIIITVTAMQVKSQIVYTDIDPDTTVYVPNVYEDSAVSFIFDLNNDGYLDFGIKLRHRNTYPTTGKKISILPKENTGA